MKPSVQQLRNWIDRVERLISATAASGLNHDLGAVVYRLEREVTARREVEGGCAWRILRLATELRPYAQQAPVAGILADMAHDLACEVVAAELLPSPDWPTMCHELGWTVAPILPTEDRSHIPVGPLEHYIRSQPDAEVILIAKAPARIYYARGLARDAREGGHVARKLWPLTTLGRPEQGVVLYFVLACGVFAGLHGDGSFDLVGRMHGTASAEHERLLRQIFERQDTHPHQNDAIMRVRDNVRQGDMATRTHEPQVLVCPPLVQPATARAQAHAEVVARRASGRPAKLDPFVGRLGLEPDAAIAARAGVSTKTVRTFRERRGIACSSQRA